MALKFKSVGIQSENQVVRAAEEMDICMHDDLKK